MQPMRLLLTTAAALSFVGCSADSTIPAPGHTYVTAPDKLKLPDELLTFLSAGDLKLDSANSEAGVVTLHPISDLQLGIVNVDSDESPLSKDDPNAGKSGSYEVPAVSLTADCDGYAPEGILVWLPNEKVFGSWDCDHYDLYVFSGATWTDIAGNPVDYIDTQWDSDRKVGKYFKPDPKYSFSPN